MAAKTMTKTQSEMVERQARRAAHAAWGGGGSLERTSRLGGERYAPLPSDYDALIHPGDPAAREIFAREFAREAKEIDDAQ